MNMTREEACVVLNIETNATLKQVNQAFKKLSLTKHPDKNKKNPNANEEFIQLKTAHNFMVNVARLTTTATVDTEQTPLRQPLPNEYDLELTLEEMFRGCVKDFTTTRKILNNGIEENEENVLQVTIEPGVLSNKRITFRNEGDNIGGIAANVVFIIKELPHSRFKRTRFNLYYTAEISHEDACFGKATIPTLDGESINLEFNNIILSNSEKVIPERGFPNPNGIGKRGDLIVRFKVLEEINRPQDPIIRHDLFITLEQFLKGHQKQIKINRKIVDSEGLTNVKSIKLTADVEPGTEEGKEFIFYQKGDKRPETIPADVVFTVKCKPDPYFKRIGVDIEHVLSITESDAQNGKLLFEIPTLDIDETLTLEINEQITADTTRRYSGYGLPYFGRNGDRGDLIVRFKILSDSCVERTIEYPFRLTLDNILTGHCKKIKYTRKIFDSDGNEFKIDKIVKINLPPGTKNGARFVYSRYGNQFPDKIPGDIVFIAQQVQDKNFTRKDDVHLEHIIKLSKEEFSLGGQVSIPTLEGKPKDFMLSDIVNPLIATKRFKKRGLPYLNEQTKRGDLIVRFKIN